MEPSSMERGSDMHGRRLDEAMKQETEGLVRSGHATRAEEFRDPEASGEDQPDVDLAPDSTLAGGTPTGMDEADVEGRSELARWLTRASFPGDRDALSAAARDHQAPVAISSRLEQLPPGRRFDTVADVWAALGGNAETGRG